MKKKIIKLFERFVFGIALIFATSPCWGKIYEKELPEVLRETIYK